MLKVLISLICVVLLSLSEAEINIQTTTYENIPNNAISQISLEPFIKLGQKYYYVESTAKLNWYAAQHYCRRRGTHLASIESEEELQAISTYLKQNNLQGWYWVAGNDLADEASFFSIATGKQMTYFAWSPGQPDNAGKNEHCVHLWPHNNGFAMNDWICKMSTYFICELHTPKMVTLTVW